MPVDAPSPCLHLSNAMAFLTKSRLTIRTRAFLPILSWLSRSYLIESSTSDPFESIRNVITPGVVSDHRMSAVAAN